ncbi:MAG TPA: sigma 54-interacting transcriptional regulator [Anaeromyxobacter sp.]|nr:sigma 54-interacting transcriptional regulator [Anaeromyxobacter sp.]
MKQSEAVPRESLEILNGIPHAAALLDPEGRVVAMNGHLETLTGHRSEDVHGVPGDLVVRSRESLARSVLDGVVRSGAASSVESDVLAADRRRVPVRITASPLRHGGPSASALLLFVEDISLVRQLDALTLRAAPVQGIVSKSARMQQVFELLPVMARTDATLLVTGETGTGKDLLAEAVHASSRRAKFPFIKVNCGALPESLLESELFGHARGAFTGAHADKPGMFRLAQGGTIFLTEIGDLPLQLQVKLLTALDDRAFYPLGASRKVEVDVRVIAGTHRDLQALVAEGRFRQDLFFRLNVLNVRLPPLREREGDVRLLADHFLEQLAKRLGKPIDGFTPQAQTVLDRYAYPGNVRELRNIVEYAASVCRDRRIGPGHLPEYLIEGGAAPARATPGGERGEGDARGRARAADGLPGKATWKDVERRLIMEALVECHGSRGEAARKLGWGRSTLWRKMKRHRLE